MKTLKSSTLIIQLGTPAVLSLGEAQDQLQQACDRLIDGWQPESDIYSIVEMAPVQPNPRNGGYQARVAYHGDANWLTIDMASELKQKTLLALAGTAWRIFEQKVHRQWLVDEFTPIFV